MLFPLKMKPENDSGKWHESIATKKWEPKHHDVLCSEHFGKKKKKKRLHRSRAAEQSVWAQIHVCRGVLRVTDFGKMSSSNFQG